MSVLERAKAHFAARPVQHIEVPEWGVTIYYKTPNPSTWSQVIRESKGDIIEQGARLVALCAMDEKGERIFTKADYTALMIDADPAVLARLATAIGSGAKINVEAAEGN